MRKDSCHHACGSRLAMGPGDRNTVFHTHQFSEHFGTRDHRNLAQIGFLNLRVVLVHGCGGHDNIHVGKILGAMAISNRSAKPGQTPGNVAFFQI